MSTNLDTIQEVIDYIDADLGEMLNLDSIAVKTGYSKYHLSRMFTAVVGLSLRHYIRRRRLTEAAQRLVFTDRPIAELAFEAGYETQQSFTKGFRELYKCSPQAYRKRGDFYPLQLKLEVDGRDCLKGDRIMEVTTVDSGSIYLIGIRKNTRFGFHVIGQCWRQLHARKHLIHDRKNREFLIGLNDYTSWNVNDEKQPAFDYLAAAEAEAPGEPPKGMECRELPPSRYIVFRFRGRNKDSLQPVADYIYKEWIPRSTCRLNEHARYDFARYGEAGDEEGKSVIEFWVPVL